MKIFIVTKLIIIRISRLLLSERINFWNSIGLKKDFRKPINAPQVPQSPFHDKQHSGSDLLSVYQLEYLLLKISTCHYLLPTQSAKTARHRAQHLYL